MDTRIFRLISSWLLVSVLAAGTAIAQPGKDKKPTDKPPANKPPAECEGNCFTTQVIRAEVNDDGCTEYELKVSHDGTCRYDLSHFTVAVPCGDILSLSNSNNWKQSIGTDPTTGLKGFKIDDIPSFGKSSDSSFTVKVTICADSTCLEKLGVVAYKAGQCVDYDTLQYPVDNGGGDDGGGDDGGGDDGGGDDGGGDDGGGDDGGGDDGGGDDGGGDDGGDTTQTCSTLNAIMKITNATCFGGSNGVIEASVTSGKAPYTYRWSTGATDSTIYNLSAGTYAVTIVDADGNVLTLSATVGQPNEIFISEVINNPSCNGTANGAIDIAVSGGSDSYTYSWNTSSTTEDASGLAAGVYTVTVTDSEGCTKQKSFVLTNETKITLSGSVTKAGCSQANGAVNLTVTGGTTPYTFSWTTGATTEDIQGLAAGSYKVTVTDASGCSTQGTFIVSENNTLRTSFAVTPAGCANEAVGAIDVTVSGGSAPYTYSWQNGATTEDISGLVSGIYRITVTDANGCTQQTAINVPKKSIQVATQITQPLCAGDSTGSITVTPVGDGTYTYLWSNGDTDNTITDVPVGSYTVVVTDASGCSRTLSYSIQQPSAITATVVTGNTECGSEGGYFADLSVTGGKAPYTYLWSTGASTQDIAAINSGTYTVLITDTNGCTLSKEVVVEASPVQWSCLITPVSEAPVCNSVGNMLSTTLTDVTYQWSVTSTDNSWSISSAATSQSIIYTAGNSGSTATFTLVIQKDGCTKTCSYTITSGCSERDNNGGGDPATGDPCADSTAVNPGETTESTPIEEQSEISGEVMVTAYPNPFEEQLTFEWTATKDEVVRLEIFDQMGRALTEVFVGKVYRGETYSYQWTANGLTDKIYFYRFTSSSKTTFQKLFRK